MRSDIQLHGLDFAVIGAYVVLLVAIGATVALRNRMGSDLFLGGRSMKWHNVGFSIFGTNIGPTFLIASCGAGYTTGMVTANFEWMAWVFLALLGMVFVPFYLNTRISTMPEFMLKRFGKGCYTFMSFYALFGTVVLWIGGTLFAGGALLAQLMGWGLMPSVWLLTAFAAGLAITGGLRAVMVCDSLQSVIMIAGATLLVVLAATRIPGWEALASVQCGDTPPELTWKLFHPAGSESPWYAFVLGYPILSIWFWCSDQTIVQKALGAKSLAHAQGGTLLCGFLKILPPFLFLFPGILAAVLLPGISDDKEVFLRMVDTFLPVGLVGLIVSVLLAAVISTLSAGLNSFSTIFTLDIYRRWISRDPEHAATRRVGQVVTLCAALMAVWIAWMMSRVEGTNLFNLFQSIIGYMAPPVSVVFVTGIFWKGATGRGALLTLVFGSALSLSVGLADLTNFFADADGNDVFPHFLLLSFYLFCGILLFMVVASLLTRRKPDEVILPSLRETYRQNPGLGKAGFAGWGALALVMLGLYLFFHLGMG
jgi:solute:Na+ symporter, SSS family